MFVVVCLWFGGRRSCFGGAILEGSFEPHTTMILAHIEVDIEDIVLSLYVTEALILFFIHLVYSQHACTLALACLLSLVALVEGNRFLMASTKVV